MEEKSGKEEWNRWLGLRGGCKSSDFFSITPLGVIEKTPDPALLLALLLCVKIVV